MAPKPIGSDDKIPCPTPDHLVMELEKLEDALAPEETEDTWQKFEKALLRFAAVTRGGAHKHVDVYLQGVGIKGLGDKIVRCMLSDRGKLSGVATDFLTSMAPRLASAFITLIPLYVPPLIKLLARPNKVYLRRAEKSLMTIAQYCPSPAFIAMIRTGVEDKSDTCRRSCGAVMAFILENWEVSWMGNKGMADIEDAMKKMATERDAEVRKIAKGMWETYNMHYADRVVGFTTPLTPTTRKYLDIKPSAGGPSNQGAKRHPLSTSTTAPKYPTMMASSGPAGRTVSSSSTSAQIGGSAAPAQQRAVSSGSKLTGSSMQSGFPFPSATETVGRSTLSRSTSAAIMAQQASAGPTQETYRSVSSMDVRGGRSTKTASLSSSSTLQSMIEPIAQARNGTAGPSRPRVISNVSASDAATATTSASGPSTAQTRRANLAAIGQGPMRPARAHSALNNVVEGREASSAMSTPRGNLFGAPVRPNLQARVTSAGFAQTAVTSGSTADSMVRPVVAKRVVSAASGLARKPILPAGLQARVNARQAETKKDEEEERDVFSAAPSKADEVQDKASRQPFKPTSSVTRETAGHGPEAKETHSRKVTKAQLPAQSGANHARNMRQSPQAKLVASPRQPRIKVKPPLPSATVPRKKATDAKNPNRHLSQNPGKPTSAAPSRDRSPFRPLSKNIASQQEEAALPPLPISPTPKPSTYHATAIIDIASRVALPPSPTPRMTDDNRGAIKVLVETIMIEDETPQLAEQVPLPDSDDEQPDAKNTSATPKRFERHESSRIADLLPCIDVIESDLLLDEECPVVDHSPTPSSSAETIPVEWDSDTLTEDEGAEGDAECEGDMSVSSVTFKRSTERNTGGKDTLGKAIARKLVAVKTESANSEEALTSLAGSDPKKHLALIYVHEGTATAGQEQKQGIEKVSSRVLIEKGSSQLPSTPEKSNSSPKRPKVKQLQQFFENLSPPEQSAGDPYNQNSPSRQASGRARVRMLSLGGTTPTSSPPPRLTT